MAGKRRWRALDAAVYGLARAFFWLLERAPEGLVYPGLDAMGRAAFGLLRGRRRIALASLRQALGTERGDRELLAIASRACGSAFMVLADVARLRRMLESGEFVRRVDRSAWDGSAPRLAEVGSRRPPILCTPHLGSWEVAGTVAGLEFHGVHVIARPLGNPYLQHWMLASRSLVGQHIWPRRGGIKHLLQALRDGQAVGTLPDQNQRLRGIFVPVFGKLASCDRSQARLAQISGAPIVVGAALRVGRRFRFRVVIADMFTVPRGGQDVIHEATARLQRGVEALVRQAPEQYFWLHNRYRTRPPDELAPTTVESRSPQGSERQAAADPRHPR